jgi:hypothetical protein
MGLNTTKYKLDTKYVILIAATKVAHMVKYVYLLLLTFLVCMCMCVCILLHYNINQVLSLLLCCAFLWWLILIPSLKSTI